MYYTSERVTEMIRACDELIVSDCITKKGKEKVKEIRSDLIILQNTTGKYHKEEER